MWLREISSAVQKRKVGHEFQQQIQGKSAFYRLFHAARYRVRIWFESFPFQVLVGCVIVASFALDVGEAELLPEKDSETDKIFRIFDGVFTFIFLMELVANLFANSESFFKAFFADAWNVLDFVVVLLSLFTLMLTSSSSKASDKIKVLRLIKIFRIVRLFRRLKSLNRIVSALGSSIIPVLNSFVILLLVTCMYATLGTYLFGRGTPKNNENFTKFSVSLFSMFQVISSYRVCRETHGTCAYWCVICLVSYTHSCAKQVMSGDAWASEITRSLFDNNDSSGNDQAVAFFFVSFFLIVGMVLASVVLTVLLDEFLGSVRREQEHIENELVAEEEVRSM